MKIAVASCSNLRDVNPQPAWADIQALRPDVLLLLGDTVYLERDGHDDPAALAAELLSLAARQQAEPGFRALRTDLAARGGRCIAVYDDHDFLGDERCGADLPPALREAARAAFVDAWAPVRTGPEVYSLQALGPVDLVALDTRFYRRSAAVSAHDPDAILGAAQWAWLAAAVSASRAPYLLLASSSTVHAFGAQSWEAYPAAFQRLRALLRGRRGALVVSGDVHRNAAYDESGVIEIVSSGVAQRSRAFGCERCNFGVLDFGADALRVQLHSRKVGSRFAFEIPLARWQLP